MVDLKSQYHKIKVEIDKAIIDCIETSEFINGNEVKSFVEELSIYTGAPHIIPCANGTDALQIALMSLELQPGDEIIVPAFSYISAAEVIALLKLVPVIVDVNPDDFSLDINKVILAINSKTKVIIPVHLFGQCSGMEELKKIADKYNIFIIEDAAQAIGTKYWFTDGEMKHAGTIGNIGTMSFFPSKNLGCFGDGGAVFTNNAELALRIKTIANHGQSEKYCHDMIGVNSRLDTIQASVLKVKLKYLNNYLAARNAVADFYDKNLGNISNIQIPKRVTDSTHTFHQYTIKVDARSRDNLRKYLLNNGIQTMVYYPIPLHEQIAFKSDKYVTGDFPVSEHLCKVVLSLPIHTEMDEKTLEFIVGKIKSFYE